MPCCFYAETYNPTLGIPVGRHRPRNVNSVFEHHDTCENLDEFELVCRITLNLAVRFFFLILVGQK